MSKVPRLSLASASDSDHLMGSPRWPQGRCLWLSLTCLTPAKESANAVGRALKKKEKEEKKVTNTESNTGSKVLVK